jgi:antitoxin component of RelBE/YafQ-DinJ toxin-antitoxin module
MAEKTTVAFRVDETVKSEWEDAAESPEYDSLSHLIRLSVQKEITETETKRPQEDPGSGLNSEALQSLNRVERVVEEIEDEVKAVARESRAEELYDLEQVLLEVLPTAPESYFPNPGEADPEEVGQKPREVAARIGADTSDVSDALESLDDKTGQVRSHRSYYWRAE